MKLRNELLVGLSPTEESICSRALSAATGEINNFEDGDELDEQSTSKVLKGLAMISLRAYGPDYHGVTPETADTILEDLFGAVSTLA